MYALCIHIHKPCWVHLFCRQGISCLVHRLAAVRLYRNLNKAIH